MEKNNIQSSPLQEIGQLYPQLYEFFIDGLKDIYWAEQAIVALLKKQKQLAHTHELMEALEVHEMETHKQIIRLERVYKYLNMKPEAQKCDAMVGIIKEAEESIMKTPEHSTVRDAVIIICAQKVEHYEIASYGGLLQIAATFGLEEIAEILEETLDEEKETDIKLTDIAESYINIEAAIQKDNKS